VVGVYDRTVSPPVHSAVGEHGFSHSLQNSSCVIVTFGSKSHMTKHGMSHKSRTYEVPMLSIVIIWLKRYRLAAEAKAQVCIAHGS